MPAVAKTSSFLVALSLLACPRSALAIKSGRSTDVPDPPQGGSFAALPPRSRVAVLFRGQAFRHGGTGGPGACYESRIAEQLGMTQSVLDKIVWPLERASHTVDIYLVESSNCTLLERIAGLLGRTRVYYQESFPGATQRDGILRALEGFRSHAPVAPESYRVVMMIRFDIVFKSYIYQWPTVNFDAFNFFSKCEPRAHVDHKYPCVSDIMYVMPGGYVPAFHGMVGRRGGECFRKHGDTGHRCWKQAVAEFGRENVSFVTDWQPEGYVRQPSPELEMF
jgi:hypothetical protein